MAAQLGQFALALAWVTAAYSVVASLLGIRFKYDKLIASGRNAAIGTSVGITMAIGAWDICSSSAIFRSNTSLRIPTEIFRFTSSSARSGAGRKARCCSGDGCLRLCRAGRDPELAETHVHDAVRHSGADDDVAVSYVDAPVRGNPFNHDRHSFRTDLADTCSCRAMAAV